MFWVAYTKVRKGIRAVRDIRFKDKATTTQHNPNWQWLKGHKYFVYSIWLSFIGIYFKQFCDSSKVLGIPYFLAPFYSIILLAATTTYIKMDSNFQLGLRGCINGQNPVNQNPLSFRCLRAIDYAVLIFFTVFMLSGLALKICYFLRSIKNLI